MTHDASQWPLAVSIIDSRTKTEDLRESAARWRDEPRTTAIMFFHALHGAVDAAIAAERTVNRARLIRSITTFVERALKVSP